MFDHIANNFYNHLEKIQNFNYTKIRSSLGLEKKRRDSWKRCHVKVEEAL